MCRCLDVQKLLAQLLPELEARLKRSGWQDDGTLRIETDVGTVILRMGRSRLSLLDRETECAGSSYHVWMPQHDLARLALGAFPPRELVARLPNPPSTQVADLLAVLFPLRYSHLHPADAF